MLIINPKYKGRFHQKAVELVKAGKRVGMMWLGPEDKKVTCHVCSEEFDKPKVDNVYGDLFSECPFCNTPFIFADAMHMASS
jgi:uncharacterized Zn-finger protein